MNRVGAIAWAPLASVRVLDLTRYVVGAITTRRLADLGADVVKIEPANGGDPVRRIPPHVGDAALWHELEDAGKRSIAVDRSQHEDQVLVRRLAGAADVVLLNGTLDGLAAFGIQHEELRTARPEVVIGLISSYGSDGPLAGQPAHGMNIDAQAGLARTAPTPDGRDTFVSGAYGGWSNEVTAHNMALGLTAGVLGAREGRGGAVVEVSCYDAAVEANRIEIAFGLAAGSGLQETLGEHIWSARHRIYRTSDDRQVYFSAVEAASWRRFCTAAGRPDLVADADEGGAIDYGTPALGSQLTALFRTRTAEEWSRLFVDNHVPANCILDASEVAGAVNFAARGLSGPPNAAGIRRIASAIRCQSASFAPDGGAPALGAHRDDVLRDWIGPAAGAAT